MKETNSIYEKESYFFLLWRTVPQTHAPFSVVTSYRLNEHETGIRVPGEAKNLFLLLHLYTGWSVQTGFCPVNVEAFSPSDEANRGQILPFVWA